jgi:hypothetical protein
MLIAIRLMLAGGGALAAMLALELLGRGRGPEAVLALVAAFVMVLAAAVLRGRR